MNCSSQEKVRRSRCLYPFSSEWKRFRVLWSNTWGVIRWQAKSPQVRNNFQSCTCWPWAEPWAASWPKSLVVSYERCRAADRQMGNRWATWIRIFWLKQWEFPQKMSKSQSAFFLNNDGYESLLKPRACLLTARNDPLFLHWIALLKEYWKANYKQQEGAHSFFYWRALILPCLLLYRYGIQSRQTVFQLE